MNNLGRQKSKSKLFQNTKSSIATKHKTSNRDYLHQIQKLYYKQNLEDNSPFNQKADNDEQ